MPDDSHPSLEGRRLILGVTGSIAAYKSALLVRLLKKAGAEVRVVMTEDAKRFITPLTLGTLSEADVLGDIFPEESDASGSWTQHVTLGRWADVFVIAPATAQTIAKLAGGFSDSMLTATVLSARCPILVCPAMDLDMYRHPATQHNLERLREYDYTVMPAAHGELASGLVGRGRMPEPEAIVTRIGDLLVDRPDAADTPDEPATKDGTRDGEDPPHAAPYGPEHPGQKHHSEPKSAHGTDLDLKGRHVLVTAGPTQEPIDPVRMLTNPSTGRMGYAIARAARRRGARVTLVSGPTSLDPPDGVELVRVQQADEMHEAVQSRREDADVIIGAAAVADYAPRESSPSKRKKDDEDLVLHLRATPDVLKTAGANKQPGQILVGFALETDDELENARRKLKSKNLDWIALNNPREEGAGFGTSTNRVTLLGRDGTVEDLPLQSKEDVADALLDRIVQTTPEPVASSS